MSKNSAILATVFLYLHEERFSLPQSLVNLGLSRPRSTSRSFKFRRHERTADKISTSSRDSNDRGGEASNVLFCACAKALKLKPSLIATK